MVLSGRSPILACACAAWAGVLLVPVADAMSAAPQPGARAPEATSLLGKPLYPPAIPPEALAPLEKNLAEAQANFDRDPKNVDHAIWLGRRLAYLARYRDAIAAFTQGITLHPDDARLHRHRGHRYITVRELDKAVADLERAAALVKGRKDEIEPDGQPNRLNRPTSTLHFNIWYHLGLAYYLKGDFERALRAYRECLKVSAWNDDALCATSDWLYMTLRRLGRDAEAAAALEPITEKLNVIENQSYHRRLLMYKGVLKPEALLDTAGADDITVATQGYGVANWHFYNGRREQAIQLFERVVSGPNWAPFGFIAAEADLARLRK